LIWTGSRSFVLGLLVKPFLAGTLEKWLFGMGTVKMVTNGGPQMHLQMAPLVSKHWGAPHTPPFRALPRAEHEGDG
jgi:hypothetical protein